MDWIPHLDLKGKHSFLSPSNNAWVNYDLDKLRSVYINKSKIEEGILLHDLASRLITQKIKVAKLKKSLNMFVNDAIGFGMSAEQMVYYSDLCFGTCDAISFKNNILRIHDLKTGETKCSFVQLVVYAAIFCLEYGIKPEDIDTELRIYQFNSIEVYIPEPTEIRNLMNKIIKFDVILTEINI